MAAKLYRIRMLKLSCDANGSRLPGGLYVVPESEAVDLIKDRAALPVDKAGNPTASLSDILNTDEVVMSEISGKAPAPKPDEDPANADGAGWTPKDEGGPEVVAANPDYDGSEIKEAPAAANADDKSHPGQRAGNLAYRTALKSGLDATKAGAVARAVGARFGYGVAPAAPAGVKPAGG